MGRFRALAIGVLLLGSCFDDTATLTDTATGDRSRGGTLASVDATASESGEPRLDASRPLTVNFSVGGTSTEGVDLRAGGGRHMQLNMASARSPTRNSSG